jgi:hypothetical protein
MLLLEFASMIAGMPQLRSDSLHQSRSAVVPSPLMLPNGFTNLAACMLLIGKHLRVASCVLTALGYGGTPPAVPLSPEQDARPPPPGPLSADDCLRRPVCRGAVAAQPLIHRVAIGGAAMPVVANTRPTTVSIVNSTLVPESWRLVPLMAI